MTSSQSAVELLRAWLTPDDAVDAPEHHTSSSLLPLPLYFVGEDGDRPGSYPFRRGVSERMYRDELWVMGMYSGYASPEATNARFKQLLEAGQTGLSIALDLPTQIGMDSDDPLAAGEIGKVGVPLNSVEDVLALLNGLPIAKIRQIRSTANAIGPIFAAFVIVSLEELGIDPGVFRLFLQNDPLKEFTARGTWIFPPGPSVRFSVDVIEYFATHHANWQPIQFCGYHIRDAGGTAVHEVAIATANGIAYLEEAERRGVDIASLAPSLFLFLAAGMDIFEEAAKFRAARTLWARLLHERFGVPESSAAIKIFAYTLGGALVAQEPKNNIVRVAYEALGAALGGVQTLATSSWDEAHSLPSEDAAHLALRTQQILGYESGVRNVVDPLAGSYYVEAMTRRIEGRIIDYTLTLLERGGAVSAIDSGFVVRELADAAFEQHKEVAENRRLVVGVNFQPTAVAPAFADSFSMPADVAEHAIARLRAVRANRDSTQTLAALERLSIAAREGQNTMPYLIAAARSRATLGEMTRALAKVFGRHAVTVEHDSVV